MNKAAVAVALVAVAYLALVGYASANKLSLHHLKGFKGNKLDGFEHEGNQILRHKLHKLHKHHGHVDNDEQDHHHGHKAHQEHEHEDHHGHKNGKGHQEHEHEHEAQHGHDHGQGNGHEHEHEHEHEHGDQGNHAGHQEHEHEHEHKHKHKHGHEHDQKHKHKHQGAKQHQHKGKQHHQGQKHGKHGKRGGGHQHGAAGVGGGVIGGAGGAFREHEGHKAGIENRNRIVDRKRLEGKKGFVVGEKKGFEADVHHRDEDEDSGIHKHQVINKNKIFLKDQTQAVNDVDGFRHRHNDDDSAHIGAHEGKIFGAGASGKFAQDREFDNDFKAGVSGEHSSEGAGFVGGAAAGGAGEIF